MLIRGIKEDKDDKELLRLKKLTNEYYYHVIDEAGIFVANTISDIELANDVWSSMQDLKRLERLIDETLGTRGVSKDVIASVEQSLTEQQRIFEAQVVPLQKTLNTFLSKNPKDKSVTILNQKINAMHRLKETLDSKKENGAKLNDFHTQLKKENYILRQHRNKGWDIFFNTICLLPFAPILSIFNRISYGTWNPKVIQGDEFITAANKRNSY